MPIQLTLEGLRKIFPRAPQEIINALLAGQKLFDDAGITHTRTRLAYCFANVEHECDGFALKGLTENINYTAERAAQIWPNRFSSAAAVREKYGTGPMWQKEMFDDVYGNRMGNRKGTHDGSDYIGRGAVQVTGRDGYREVGQRCGLDLERDPAAAAKPDNQAKIIAAFWTWKNLNANADAGDFAGVVRVWNGGHIGMADREARLRGNDPVIARLEMADRTRSIAVKLPGGPPTPQPPKEIIDAATAAERRTQAAGAAAGSAGAASETTKAVTVHPTKPATEIMPSFLAWSFIGLGVALVIIAGVLIYRKRAAIIENWK